MIYVIYKFIYIFYTSASVFNPFIGNTFCGQKINNYTNENLVILSGNDTGTYCRIYVQCKCTYYYHDEETVHQVLAYHRLAHINVFLKIKSSTTDGLPDQRKSGMSPVYCFL